MKDYKRRVEENSNRVKYSNRKNRNDKGYSKDNNNSGWLVFLVLLFIVAFAFFAYVVFK